MLSMFPRSDSATVQTPGRPLERLIVPVNASMASARAVATAIALAHETRSEIVLVALLTDLEQEDELDAELVRARFLQTELGLGIPDFPPAPDEATRIKERYDFVLLPLQRKVKAAGIPVELRLLRGEALGKQFRDLLQEVAPSVAIVLSNPQKLYGPLYDLTSELWANPQCATYVAGAERAAGRRSSLLTGALQRLLHRPLLTADGR